MKQKVQVWVCDQDKYLLLQTTSARGSFWQPVTGHANENEEVIDAAQREMLEETGLNVKGSIHFVGFEFQFKSSHGTYIETCFYVEVDSLKPFPEPVLDPNEHTAFKWCDTAQVKKLLKFASNMQCFEILEKNRSRKKSMF